MNNKKIIALTSFLLLTSCVSEDLTIKEVVKIDSGVIKGSHNAELKQYLGIPYAEPPIDNLRCCLLYTSPSPRDLSTSRMPSSA